MRQHGFFYAAGTASYNHPRTRRDRLAQFMLETIANESGDWTDTACKAGRTGDQ